MTTYNTGNPIGSTDARDLYDNAQNLDNFANGASASYADRLGVIRRSLAGIEATAEGVLNGIGYAVPVAYVSGISLTLTSQTVDYNGVIYAPLSSALPFTTSSWGTDSAKFRAIQVTDADLITYTPAGTGAVATTVQSKLRETVSITDFGAVGDWNGTTGTNNRTLIQAAIDAVSAAGGGRVTVPQAGRFMYDGTLYIPANVELCGAAMPGFFYPPTGSRLVAKFTNSNSWAIESDTRKASDNSRVDYRGFVTGADIDAGNYTRNENVAIRNLFIEVVGSLYGGIRLMGCPGYVRENVGVQGADIGFFACASWGVVDRRLWGLSYLYGYAAGWDINGLELSGYFDCTGSKTISDANRPTWLGTADIGPAVGTRDFKNDRIGAYLYYTNAAAISRLVVEHFDVGRAYIKALATSEDAGYSEGNLKTILAIVGSDHAGAGLRSVNDVVGDATSSYEFGVGCASTLTNFPGRIANVSAFASVHIDSADPDVYGWKWSDRFNFIGQDTTTLRVSATGSASNIGGSSTYTTLGEALRRIESGQSAKWRVIIKDGDTVDVGNKYNVENKKISFEREGSGANPTIRFVTTGGYPLCLRLLGDCGLRFKQVNIAYTAATTPADGTDTAGIFLNAGSASAVSLIFDYSTIDLQTGWSLIQQGYYSVANMQASFISCTINGSSNAKIMNAAPGNDAQTNVISRQHATTAAASIKAFGTNGWVNANVISSNF